MGKGKPLGMPLPIMVGARLRARKNKVKKDTCLLAVRMCVLANYLE